MLKKKITYWKVQIDQNTRAFSESFGVLAKDSLNWTPDGSVWSIAQNMAHIMLLNESYFKEFDKIIARRNKLSFLSRIPGFARYSANIIRPFARQEANKKATTWDIWEPKDAPYDGAILFQFRQHQEKFKKYLDELRDVGNDRTKISYPGKIRLVFRLQDAVEILVTHEERHYKQACQLFSMAIIR